MRALREERRWITGYNVLIDVAIVLKLIITTENSHDFGKPAQCFHHRPMMYRQVVYAYRQIFAKIITGESQGATGKSHENENCVGRDSFDK